MAAHAGQMAELPSRDVETSVSAYSLLPHQQVRNSEVGSLPAFVLHVASPEACAGLKREAYPCRRSLGNICYSWLREKSSRCEHRMEIRLEPAEDSSRARGSHKTDTAAKLAPGQHLSAHLSSVLVSLRRCCLHSTLRLDEVATH
eukprot:2558059-Amphidinium_carterae.1